MSQLQTGLFLSADLIQAGGVAGYRNPRLEIKSRVLPNKPLPGYVRIKMKYAGICGTDIDLLKVNPETLSIRSTVPLGVGVEGRLMGHEGIGSVIQVGESVVGFGVGDWVVPAGLLNCGQCQWCLRGFPNQCDKATLLGSQLDGIYVDVLDLPIQLLCNVSSNINSDRDVYAHAALEPASTSLNACEAAAISSSDQILIFGAGPIGAYCAMIAKIIFNCRFVSVVEPILNRRKIISEWVDFIYTSVNEIPMNSKFDVIIEASGYLSNVTSIFNQMNPRGRVVLLARSGEALNFNFVDALITNAISITGCRGQLGGYMSRMSDYHACGKFPMDALLRRVGSGLNDLNKFLMEDGEQQRLYCKNIIEL